jgi:hypothetical protein
MGSCRSEPSIRPISSASFVDVYKWFEQLLYMRRKLVEPNIGILAGGTGHDHALGLLVFPWHHVPSCYTGE